jgi:hypothetical protein
MPDNTDPPKIHPVVAKLEAGTNADGIPQLDLPREYEYGDKTYGPGLTPIDNFFAYRALLSTVTAECLEGEHEAEHDGAPIENGAGKPTRKKAASTGEPS